MVMDLREIFAQTGGAMPVECNVNLSDAEYNGTICMPNPVEVTGRVFNRAGVVNFEYTANFAFTAPCDRCAVEVSLDKSESFSHVVVTQLVNEEDFDGSEYIITPSMTLDVDSIVREDVLLSLPTKHLCDEDCKGICAGCGVNLNEQECKCEKEIDPRLAKLRGLLSDQR